MTEKKVRPGVSKAWNSLWRDPRRAGWLMLVYFLLSPVTGPVIYLRVSPAPLASGPGAFGWVFSAFFAWRVTRGGRVSRMLLIIGTVISCLAVASVVALRFTPAALGVLAAGGAQLTVLLSPAVYQRTRPGGGTVWTGEPAGTRPRPRRRGPRWLAPALAITAAAGLTRDSGRRGRRRRPRPQLQRPNRAPAPRPAVPRHAPPGRYFTFVGCLDYYARRPRGEA